MNQASLPAVAGDGRRTPIVDTVRGPRSTPLYLLASIRPLRIARSHLTNGPRQGTAFYPERSRRAAVPRSSHNSGVSTPEVGRTGTRDISICEAGLAQSSRILASKGCQALPGLFRRKSLKTRVRGAQRVSRIRIAISALAPIPNRQCCRIEIAVAHTKQRIGILPNRQKTAVVSSPSYEQTCAFLSAAGIRVGPKPGATQAMRETRSST